MKRLSRPTKCDKLISMFDEKGKKIKIEQVLGLTGIASLNSLKVLLSYIRNAPHIPDENRVNIRIKEGYCIRD